jgi:phosphatidylinositol alpha-1,6-mannosyltransferase
VIRTLLVTNDFPPKLGGIQSYLGELWRRLDPASTSVLTASSHPDADAHDAELRAMGFDVDRVPRSTLYLPTPAARRAIDRAVARTSPDLILYDPFVPLGLCGERHGVPYGVVLHGAEVTIPCRVPLVSALARRVLSNASVLVSAGSYPEAEARRVAGSHLAPVVRIPPGVDVAAYAPLEAARRAEVRTELGVSADTPLVVTVGRLVPRKGIDVLLGAVDECTAQFDGLTLVVVGAGRDARRLEHLAARTRASVTFTGAVEERRKIDLLGAADVFAQPCRSRWGGLEQEGFGIVFLEAAACGTPQLAGRSGGSYEAVDDGVTGLVVDAPESRHAVARSLVTILGDPDRRTAMGAAARRRAVESFDYDELARQLTQGIEAAVGGSAQQPGPAAGPR